VRAPVDERDQAYYPAEECVRNLLLRGRDEQNLRRALTACRRKRTYDGRPERSSEASRA
jgi:hypothetical protein